MPAGGGEIIREFLVGLGFTVNDTQLRSFNYAINRVASITLSSMNKMGAGVAIAAASVAADVLLIASSLQKMYYVSKLSGASATNIKALQEGAKQVGVSVEAMTGAIENFGFRLKTEVALPSLVKGLLGVETQGRDTGDVIVDMVDKLKTLPPWLANIYEGILKLDPQTFYLLGQGSDQFKKSIQQTKDQLKAAGIDMDEEARKAKDLENQISELKRQWDILSVAMESWAVGPATKAVSYLNWLKTQSNFNMWAGKGLEDQKPGHGITNALKGAYFWDPLSRFNDPGLPPAPKGVGGPPSNLTGGPGPSPIAAPNLGGGGKEALKQRAREIAAMFGLDPDLMIRLIEQESGFNPRAVNKKSGATGLMQLMAGTAAGYGVTDRTNPEQNMMGGMAYFSELLEKYKGNVNLALAEYNAGPKAMAKYGGIPPFKETQNYVAAINGTRLGSAAGGGVTIHQKTDIHVNGAGDPRAVGRSVADEQTRVNGTIVRDLSGVGGAR